MKPKPFSELNHFTVPVAIVSFLLLLGPPGGDQGAAPPCAERTCGDVQRCTWWSARAESKGRSDVRRRSGRQAVLIRDLLQCRGRWGTTQNPIGHSPP